MELRTLTKRIAQKFGVEIPTPDNLDLNNKTSHSEQIPFDSKNYEHIKTVDRLKTWINKIYETGYVAIDTETTSLNDMLAELVGISLSIEIGLACYIPIGHKEGQNNDLFENSQLAEGQLDLEFVLESLRPILEDDSILKIGQNIKYDAKVLDRYGVMITAFDDTMLLSYALHGGLHNHGMDALSQRYLEHSPIAIKTLIGSGKSAITFDKVKIDDAVAYAAEDADITLRLWKIFKQKLHLSRVTKVYETLERPLVSVLAQVEKNGIKVDRETLSRMSNAFAQKMASLEAEIYEMAGDTFNVGSPKQLGEIMFDKLGYEGGKKGKNGAYATGADILEDLATNHDFPKRVLDWRQLSKLKSTYTDALQDHINPNTGRVHTSYSIAGAVTGRLSSTEPNLQNIPVRTEDGRRIREAFVAESGNILVSLDYSQIELRILAHIAQIDALQQAFHDGLDIHAMTASEMFNVPLDEMTSEIRRQAKAINFGVIYGISGFGLARNLRIPRSEAQGFIDRYFERFPGIKEYMDKTVKLSKENNYVETLFGRVIHTPEINAKGPMAGFAKRAAINAPIQGTAADIIRRAMIRVPDAIKGMPAKMLLQVHDELLFEVKEEDYEELIAKVRSIMETASLPFLKMDIPLSVDAGRGLNWAEAH
jgi:DNA polymerase-1